MIQLLQPNNARKKRASEWNPDRQDVSILDKPVRAVNLVAPHTATSALATDMSRNLASVALFAFALSASRVCAEEDERAWIFTPYARCDSSNVVSFGGGTWTFPTFEAELQLSVPVDSYVDHYNYVAFGTGRHVNITAGRSRLSISVLPQRTPPTSTAFRLKAHIHTSRCDVNNGGGHYLYDPTGPDAGDNIFETQLDFPVGYDISHASVERTFLADYDATASVVLHDTNGARIGCCNLVPNLPILPDTWSATIEANIYHEGVGLENVSYSMLRHEWYDKATGNLRIDEHSAYSKQTRLMNAAKESFIALHRNETFPKGHCEAHSLDSSMARFLTRGMINHTLASTADFLAVTGHTPDEYHGTTAATVVRGIPCEKWSRNVTMPSMRSPGVSHSYVFEFFFPVTSWMIRQESYHRMLARVVVKSDYGFRGDRVLHYYDFIDMRPYVDDDSIFDPCAVYPTGAALAGNCTCAGAEVEKNGMGLAAVAGIVFVILLVAMCAGFGGFVFWTRYREEPSKLIDEGNEMTPI